MARTIWVRVLVVLVVVLTGIPVLVNAALNVPLVAEAMFQLSPTPSTGGPDDLGILPVDTPVQAEAPAVEVTESAPVVTPSPAVLAPTPTGAADSEDDFGILPTFGRERLTVVILGSDTRPSEMEAVSRTDTIMLVSLDPATNKVGVLGIPRDLWVTIPGFGYQRINAAYAMGEGWQPGYGSQLVIDTIRTNFGMPVDHYALIDFNTFVTVVDLVGGIDIEVDETINDPTYPDATFGYDPFYLEAGMQHLDGATALKYVRTRHNSDDRVRIKRQQQVALAVLEKVTSPAMFASALTTLPEIWDAITEGVQTDMSLADVMDLALYARAIPAGNIAGEVMDWRYASPAIIAEQSVLVPNTAAIPGLMVELFGPTYYE